MWECIECGMPYESTPAGNPFCSDECEENYETDAMKVVY